MTVYAPGTQEKDPTKQNMALQEHARQISLLNATAATISGGQIPFPATQNPSADANTLDDYEEGTWTPTVTFATPGNLAVTYSQRNAYYTKVGRLVSASLVIVTSAFTYTTASGALEITGLPFTAVNDANYIAYMPLIFGGINKAGYTGVYGAVFGNASQLLVFASGMGSAAVGVTTADVASGGTVVLGGVLNYVTPT